MSHTTTINDTEFMGAVKTRFLEVDIDNYEQGAETFGPTDAGMNRFQQVVVEVADDSMLSAHYDAANGVIRLVDGGAEAAAGETASLSVTTMGK